MSDIEIRNRIEKENEHLAKCTSKIKDIKFDISATKRAIKFWKGELKKKTEKKGK